jgi:hypothetical protein
MTMIESIMCKNKKKSKLVCITTDDKRKIVDKVKMLSKDVHMEIFYFLHKINNYTLNGNGVFFNLNNLNDETLYTLKKMVIFYNKNEKKLKENYLDRYTKNGNEEEPDNNMINERDSKEKCKNIEDEDEDEDEDESSEYSNEDSSEDSGDENTKCCSEEQQICNENAQICKEGDS